MVIVMIGILAIVVIPSFNASAFLERGFYDELKSAARHAQKLAVASGCPVRLIATSTTSYTLKQSADCGASAWDTDVQHPARSGGYAGTAPSGVTITGGSVVFQPDGSSATGNFSAGGRTFTIASTGYVSGD